jgi:hypothetical protein
MRLTRDAILAAKDTRTEVVAVPEWGGEVQVRGLTGRERDDFEASMMERRGRQTVANTANVRAKLVVRCCIDDSGERLFTDGDAVELGEKSGAAIDRVYEKAAKLSGMTDESVSEAAENFSPTATNGSSTSSPGNSTAPSPGF